jgi:hypothetical protein
VGIDLGVSTTATLSSGEKLAGPKALAASLAEAGINQGVFGPGLSNGLSF